MNPETLAEIVIKEGRKAGADEVATIIQIQKKNMTRAANNEAIVTQSWRNIQTSILVSRQKKIAVSSLEDSSPESIKAAVKRLVKIAKVSKSNLDYAPLPEGPVRYKRIQNIYDSRIPRQGHRLINHMNESIKAAIAEGAQRVAVTLVADETTTVLETSNNMSGTSRATSIEITTRAFAADDASGQGISCATELEKFSPREAGERAGRIAKMSLNPEPGEAGRFHVVLDPTVIANFISNVASAASAYAVDAGFSFFTDLLGQKVASENFTLVDSGNLAAGIYSRGFDDEGIPTQSTTIIENGVLKSLLHNTKTAHKFKTKSTGNAGWIFPSAWNLLLNPGDREEEALFDAVGTGVYISNNWYTRFQNLRTSDFSTICRDGVFRIQGGKLGRPLKGLRVSDNMLRILRNISYLSKNPRWIKWWEVDNPTHAPYVAVRDVGLTKSTK